MSLKINEFLYIKFDLILINKFFLTNDNEYIE
jgi:hypothetical protein